MSDSNFAALITVLLSLSLLLLGYECGLLNAEREPVCELAIKDGTGNIHVFQVDCK